MSTAPKITPEMAHELAVATKVCVRPLVRRVLDQATGAEQKVALPCNSTREDVCPSCADKNRRLRMQQCAEGWHRTDELERPAAADPELDDDLDELDDDQADDEDEGRRTRSTRRRDDTPDLPRVPCEDRTIGRTFTTPDGKVYQPSMFLTLTMPSYGKVKSNGAHSTRPPTTTGGPHSMRCTSRNWSTGSGSTCAAAPATKSSTSPPSNPNNGSPRTCTPRSAEPSPGPP